MVEKIKKEIKKLLSRLMNVFVECNYDNVFNGQETINKINKRIKKLERLSFFRLDVFLDYPVKKVVKGGSLLSNDGNKHSLRKKWLSLYDILDDRGKVLSAYFVYMLGIFDDEVCKKIIESIPYLENKHLRYWLTQNISKMTFFMQNGLYENYFTDRRMLLKQCALDMNLDVPKTSLNKTGEKKLCLVTYLMSTNPMNSEMRLAIMTANRFSKYYDEILIVVLDCFLVGEDDEHSLGSLFMYRPTSGKKKEIENLFTADVSIHFCIGKNYRERFQDAINAIYSFKPSDIVDLSDEYSVISYYYSQSYNTLNMLLRIGATSIFDSKVFWDYSGEICRMLNKKYHFTDDAKIINWGLPEVIPEEEISLNRKDYGIDENAFVILTLGLCAKFSSQEFLDELCNFLFEYENAIWLIVGDVIPEYINNKYGDLIQSKRIISKEFEKHIVSLCSFCNILLRVDTTGGSGGTAIAAKQGLPIVMTNFYCDPMLWLGLHYSKIDNYKDLFIEVRHLFNDKSYYEYRRNEVMALVAKAEDTEDKWLDLYKKMKDFDKINEDRKVIYNDSL